MSPGMFGVPTTYDELMGIKKPIKKKEKKTSTKPKELKRKVYADDFYKLMDRQKGMCASKDCAKNNGGVRQEVTTIKDIDHIYPIKLWELKKKKGNPNALSNLQLLCLKCHRLKSAEDRKKIALYKEKLKTTKKPTDTKKPSGKKPSKGKPTYQTKYYNAITGKWEKLRL